MGETLALLSGVCFGASNIAIARGAREGGNNGAFLSLLMTVAFAVVAWGWQSARGATPPVNVPGLVWFIGAGVMTAFFGRVFLYASVEHLGAVRGAAIKRLAPFFTVVLGVGVMGDVLSAGAAVGAALIAISFVVLVVDSLARERGQVRRTPAGAGEAAAGFNPGYLYGPVSALGYAFGSLGRKEGLAHIADPFLGTIVGTLAGIALFVAMGTVRASYRRAVRLTFTRCNGWLYLASALSSLGQLLYFGALAHTTISRVALITSLEVFVTMFLTAWVVRSGERTGGVEIAAAVIGVVGTGLLVST